MTTPDEEFWREAMLFHSPELYAHLLEIERHAEPFFGVNEPFFPPVPEHIDWLDYDEHVEEP